MKKLFTFLAAICCTVLFTCKAETVTSGVCGDHLTWEYTSVPQTLTITGYGAMYDYDDGTQPWSAYLDNIRIISLPEGLTYIGEDAFIACESLAEIEIPRSVESTGGDLFLGCDSLWRVVFPAHFARRISTWRVQRWCDLVTWEELLWPSLRKLAPWWVPHGCGILSWEEVLEQVLQELQENEPPPQEEGETMADGQ